MNVAETLREWASGADEEMTGPLRELAAQYEAEVKALEAHYLAPVADLLRERCKVNAPAESFGVLEGLGVVAAKLEAFEAAEAERLRKREAGQKVLADRRKARMTALDQLVRSLVELRNVDAPPEADPDRAAFDQHIAALQGRYGRDASFRD